MFISILENIKELYDQNNKNKYFDNKHNENISEREIDFENDNISNITDGKKVLFSIL